MARKEKYRCLEGYISQEGKEHEKVLCHPKHDAFMEMIKKKKTPWMDEGSLIMHVRELSKQKGTPWI